MTTTLCLHACIWYLELDGGMLVRGAARAEWREGGQETSRGPEPGPGDPHVASSPISCPTLIDISRYESW